MQTLIRLASATVLLLGSLAGGRAGGKWMLEK